MAARLAWVLAVVSLAFAVADTIVTAAYRTLVSEAAVAVHGWPFAPAASVGATVMGAVIVSRYARHPIGWLLCGIGVVSAASLFGETYGIWVLDYDGPGADRVGHLAGWISVLTGGQVALGLFAVVFLIAPDGRLLSRPWRYAIAAATLGITSCTVALLTLSPAEFVNTDLRFEGRPVADVLFSFGILLIAASMVAAVVSMIRRLRRAHGDERQQLRLIALAASAIAAGLVWLIVGEILNGGEQNWLVAMPLFVAYVALPICVAVAVLRFRLYDIDVIINRAVVLAVGTGFAAVGYVAVVVTVGAAVGSGTSGVWPSVIAMIMVALAFQPLRRRVVRLADRIAYGARAAPYEALADFSRRLGGSPAPEALLPTVAEATGSAVLAHRVMVRLVVPDGVDRWAQWPAGSAESPPTSDATEIDVVDRGERLGSIGVVMPPGRSLRASDRALLTDLADQAALAFRNNRLAARLTGQVAMLHHQTAELAESRARIIAARDEERDRLEQAIRAGVAPHLEPAPARLRRMAADVRARGVESALSAVLADSIASLEGLREISRGIMPQHLVQSGLAAAIAAHLRRAGHGGALVVDDSVMAMRFDRSMEATAYLCLLDVLRPLAPPIEVRMGALQDCLTIMVRGTTTQQPTSTSWRDRLESIGASADSTTDDGHTVVAISIPTGSAPTPTDGQPLHSCG